MLSHSRKPFLYSQSLLNAESENGGKLSCLLLDNKIRAPHVLLTAEHDMEVVGIVKTSVSSSVTPSEVGWAQRPCLGVCHSPVHLSFGQGWPDCRDREVHCQP